MAKNRFCKLIAIAAAFLLLASNLAYALYDRNEAIPTGAATSPQRLEGYKIPAYYSVYEAQRNSPPSSSKKYFNLDFSTGNITSRPTKGVFVSGDGNILNFGTSGLNLNFDFEAANYKDFPEVGALTVSSTYWFNNSAMLRGDITGECSLTHPTFRSANELTKLRMRWLPTWDLGGGDALTGRVALRAGHLWNDGSVIFEPISQNLANYEFGLSYSKNSSVMPFNIDIGYHRTLASYENSSYAPDNEGQDLSAGVSYAIGPGAVIIDYAGARTRYNTDRYFFMDDKERIDSATVSYEFPYANIRFSPYYTYYITGGGYFADTQDIAGLRVESIDSAFDISYRHEREYGDDFAEASLEKNFGGGSLLKLSYKRDLDNVYKPRDRIAMTFGLRFGSGPAKKTVSRAPAAKFTDYSDPFAQPRDYNLDFDGAVSRLKTLPEVVNWNAANINYKETEWLSSRETYDGRAGDCDDQAIFQSYVLSKHEYQLTLVGYKILGDSGHGFSYAEDRKRGGNYIFEYGMIAKVEGGSTLDHWELAIAILENLIGPGWYKMAYQDIGPEFGRDSVVVFGDGWGDWDFTYREDVSSSYLDLRNSIRIVPQLGIRNYVDRKFEE